MALLLVISQPISMLTFTSVEPPELLLTNVITSAVVSGADIDECAIANGGCSHRCVNSPGGHRCECPPGMQINSGGRKCV
ncbi:EGF-like domain protein, partial [Ancylostoma duodenale]